MPPRFQWFNNTSQYIRNTFLCATASQYPNRVYDPSPNSEKQKEKEKAKENFSDNIDDWEWKTTKPYIPPVNGGKVIKVYDGDTITVASKLPYPASPVYRFQVRINGIDSPEMHGNGANERIMAIASRDALSEKILGKMVSLRNVTTEKYGRVLADVFFEEQNMGIWMIDSDLAVEYHGGTKEKR